MMVDSKTVSNNTLVVLLVGAMFIALLGSVVSMNKIDSFNNYVTGAYGGGGDTWAEINLTITDSLYINFTEDSVNFGSGYAEGGICTLYNNGTSPSSNCNFASIGNLPLILKNIGNTNVSLNLSHMQTFYSPTNLFGGTDEYYAMKFVRSNGDTTCTGICTNCQSYNDAFDEVSSGTWTEDWELCEQFNYKEGDDEINLYFKIDLNTDSDPGDYGDVWTAVATAI